MAELLKDAQIDALFPTPIMRLRWDEAEARNPNPDYPSNGVLVLHNPKGGDRIGFLRSPYMPLTYQIDPEPGLMVLFPSHLVDSVNPYQGGRPRISISFNLMKDPYP